MRSPSHCEFSPDDFTATALTTSAGRLVHVSGSALCPTAGWELRLVAGNSGIVPRPDTLTLELRETARHGAPRVRTKTAVEAIIEDSRAVEVAIRFSWREGFVIPVRDPAGRRAGGRRAPERADDASGRFEASAV
jgi:hypothetical protein